MLRLKLSLVVSLSNPLLPIKLHLLLQKLLLQKKLNIIGALHFVPKLC
jgi:hypothetical protein